jgi:hypothetical protein
MVVEDELDGAGPAEVFGLVTTLPCGSERQS